MMVIGHYQLDWKSYPHLLTAWFIASMIPGGRVVVVVVLRVVLRGVSRVVGRVGRCVVRTVDVSLPSVLSCKLSNVVDVSAPFIGLPSGVLVELLIVDAE